MPLPLRPLERDPELRTGGGPLRDPELLRAALPDERLEPELRTGGGELLRDPELRWTALPEVRLEPELRRTALPEDRLEPVLRRTALPEVRLEPVLRVAVRPLLVRDGGGRLTEERVVELRCTVDRVDEDVLLRTGAARRPALVDWRT